jgi:hypothetical protein
MDEYSDELIEAYRLDWDARVAYYEQCERDQFEQYERIVL